MLLSNCWGGNKILYMGSVYATMQQLRRKQTSIYEECVYATKQQLGRKQTTIYGLCVYAAM